MNDEFLYEKIVRQLARKIETGVLKPGDKIPSVRRLASQRGVAIITVLKAYGILEDRALIAGHLRSGYVVAANPLKADLPRSALRQAELGKPGFVELAREVVIANRNPALVSFGAASLSNELLPVEELRVRQARIERVQFGRIMRYEPWGGTSELREAVAARAALWGVEMEPQNCLVTSGGTQAIQLAIQTVLKPGSRVAVESPCYFGTLWALEKTGIKIVEVPTTADSGVRVEVLDRLFKDGSVDAAILHPNFQNPLGSVMPVEAKIRVAALAKRYKIPVIEADTTADLYLSGARPKPIQAFDRAGWVLAYGSFSKLIAPGFRVGYLAPGRFIRQAEEGLRAISLATATGSQLTLAKFLRDGGYESHLRRLRKHFQIQLPRAVRALQEALPADTRICSPQGGYLIWLQLPRGISGLKVWRRALREGISVTPGTLFSTTGKYGAYLRLNLGMIWSPKVELAIQSLGRIVRQSQ